VWRHRLTVGRLKQEDHISPGLQNKHEKHSKSLSQKNKKKERKKKKPIKK
jgi:hypothetical protein